MDERNEAAEGGEASCSCRAWVEQELARLRQEIAHEVSTRRLRVAATDGGGVLIEADEHRAVVQVATADGNVLAEIVATADESEAHAGFTLTARGDVVAVLSVLQPKMEGPTVARLVFDQPESDRPWAVVDADGVHLER